MADDVKFPWESKTEIVAFIGLVSSLLVSFGFAGANLTTEQIAGIGTLLFLVVMIVRQYGGGLIVLTEGAKLEKKAELDQACIAKAEEIKVR
jgi:hypothetical protein